MAIAIKNSTITTSTKEYQSHQRSCSMQSTIMIPDDNLSGIIPGIQHPPEICVDYLSHDWKKEDDIWTSWKVMSKQKKEIANGVRLENASWRTWAKQKYDLKTVNPEKLNWSKDSDVTWLYGPLHTAWSPNRHVDSQKLHAEDNLHLMQSSTTKSCLKKKSISDILCPTIKGRYGSLVSSNSDTQLYKRDQDGDADLSDCETASTCSSISGPTTPTTEPTKSVLLPTENDGSHHRKIQFNDRVEQCIAVDSDEELDDKYAVSDPESSSDDGIEMKISSKKKRKDCSTICKLAPTKLKEDRIHNNEYSSLYSNNKRRITTTNGSTNTAASAPTTTVATSSSTPPSWIDDDEDLDVDVDEILNFGLEHSTHYHTGRIISQPPPNKLQDENQPPQDHDDHGIVVKAVNIATGVREIINLVFNL